MITMILSVLSAIFLAGNVFVHNILIYPFILFLPKSGLGIA